jgi:CheY-like chemotaxis protein
VLLNLAVNARDAMPGGGALTIETSEVDLDQGYADAHVGVTPGPYVLMAVSDTGHGMDEETRQRVFEPFFTTKGVGKGTGLGLATVYGIVKQHGGNIWVYSEPGKGTTFKVYLPRLGGQAPAADRPVVQAPAIRGSGTILVVEDEPGVLNVVSRILGEAGYTVLTATNPLEAELLLAQHTGEVRLLVTDVVMPGGSGPELYERLSARHPSLKVLYMSGYTDHGVVRDGILTPEDPFIQKPFTPQALAEKVRGVLGG